MEGLRIGQTIYFALREDTAPLFKAHVMEMMGDSYFTSQPRSVNTDIVQQPVCGEVYWIQYISLDGRLCKFKSSTEEMQFGTSSFWKLISPKPDETIREQRREFVRVPADIPVRIEISREHESSILVETVIKDISGGGMAVLLPQRTPLKVGDFLRAIFSLTNNNFVVDTECFVVRITEPNDRGFCVVSLQYLQVMERVRQRIIQYVFWRQRSLV